MADEKGWLSLTTRYGGGGQEPSDEDLVRAAEELYEESIPGMREGDYAEHPNAWLTLGWDSGPVYIVDAYRSKLVILSKFAGQDDRAPASEVRLKDVPMERVLALWTWLARRQVECIRSEYPTCGW